MSPRMRKTSSSGVGKRSGVGSVLLSLSLGFASGSGITLALLAFTDTSWRLSIFVGLFVFIVGLGLFAMGYESAKDDYKIMDKVGRLWDQEGQ